MKTLSVAALVLLVPVSFAAHAACGSTDAHSTPAQVVQAQVDAYNAHAIEALVACYADDASLAYLSGEQATIKGKAAIRKAFGFLPGQSRDFHVEILKRVATGPVVIDEERLHGLPPGKHLPDAFAVYEVHAGLITKVWFPPAK